MTSSGHAPGSAVVAETITMTVVAAVVTILRLYTRTSIVQKTGIDDVCIVIALALTIALTITMAEQVYYGMGRHYSSLTENDKYRSLIWFWASVWIYYAGLGFTKMSILLQYLRILPTGPYRTACFVLIGIVVAYTLGTFFASIFACTPVAYFWDKSLQGTCVNETAVWFANASINIVTDICTAVLPIPVLKSLQIPKRQKYALMAVFGLGGFTCIVSILRLQSLYVVSHTNDISWNNPLAAIWSSTELNVGIICSCLPTLKALIKLISPGLFSSSGYGYGSNVFSRRASGHRDRISMHSVGKGPGAGEKRQTRDHTTEKNAIPAIPELAAGSDGRPYVNVQRYHDSKDEDMLRRGSDGTRLTPARSTYQMV